MAKLVFREPAMDKLLLSPSGEVGRYLSKKGRLIEAGAKRQVGVQIVGVKVDANDRVHLIHKVLTFGRERRRVAAQGKPFSVHAVRDQRCNYN